MKSFKRFIALVLCAVMLVGIVPMAFNPNKVSAADPVDAVVQGENDVVLVFDSATADSMYGNYFVKALLAGAKSLKNNFDRIILIWAVDANFTKNSGSPSVIQFYASTNTSLEHIVITQKCMINYPALVKGFRMTGATSYAAYNNSKSYTAGQTLDYFSGDDHKTWSITSAGDTFALGCDVELDYINVSFKVVNPFFYCRGFDLTIGENVNFTYADTAAKNHPIVINGFYDDDSFHTAATDSRKNTQTITLLGGDYQYVSPRSRNATATNPAGKTININLGDVKFETGGLSLECFANDSFEGSTINLTIDGTTFKNYIYLYGRTTYAADVDSAPSADNSTINIYYYDATISNYFVGVRGSASNDAEAELTHKNANVNFFVAGAVADNKLRGDYGSNGKGKLDSVTASVYYNPIFISNPATTFKYFDNYYTYDASNSTLTYTCGDSCGENNLAYVNNTGVVQSATWDIKVDSDIHSYAYGLRDGMPVASCSNCYDEQNVQLADEKPVVFVNSTIADDAGNSGLTADSPFETLKNAFTALSNWGVGGTIVLSGPCYYTSAEDGSGTNAMNLKDAGGTVIMTSVFGGVDYRENVDDLSGNACWVTVDYIKFNNDMIIENVDFLKTAYQKAWFMNYNDLMIDDSCRTYTTENYVPTGATDGSGKPIYTTPWTDSLVPVKGVEIDEISDENLPWLNIATGSSRSEKKTAGAKDFGVQNIVLEGGFIHQILSGNKFAVERKFGSTINDGSDANAVVAEETPVGTTNIYIGGNAIVEGIDTYTDYEGYDITTNVIFVDDQAEFEYLVYSGNGYIDMPETDNIVILVSEAALETIAENVYVMNDAIFGEACLWQKVENNVIYGLRVTYTTGNDFAAWVDEAGVEEFGVLMSLYDNADKIKYISTSHANGIGKSVAYDETSRNYLYAGGNTAVEFSGTLLAQDDEGNDLSQTFKQYDFAAVPYAVVNGANGKYTVIGSAIGFDCFGLLD